ncbi:MAG: hypothetical protein FJ035_10295, partial [Chloroflexi bacterium]|nr:hypothetical protein [Chloroflexota bacterium]
MQVTPAGAPSGHVEPNVAAAGAAERTFGAALDEQARRGAARELMAALPPMLAQAVQQSAPGTSPADPSLQSVGALLEGIRNGEWTPSAEQRAARGSVIGATAQAADVFASAE